MKSHFTKSINTEPGMTEEELSGIHAIQDAVDEIINAGGDIPNDAAITYRASWQRIDAAAEELVNHQDEVIERLATRIEHLEEENRRLVSATVPLSDKSWFCGLAGEA